MNYKFYKFIILVILTFIVSCTKENTSFIKNINIFYHKIFNHKKKQAYLFYYEDYYSIFTEKVKIYKSIQKKLNRFFFKVNEIKIKSFAVIPSEINKLKTKNINRIIFLDNYLFPLIFKTSIFEDENTKLITYDIPITDINIDSKIPIFNIVIDDKIIKKSILKACKKFSKKEDLSDCGIIINNDYFICSKFDENIKKDKINPDILILNTEDKRDPNKILNWLNNKERNVIVLFGYELNKIILDINKDQFKNSTFIEVMTNYGESTVISAYVIDIVWDKAVKAAINSSEFYKFINLHKNNDKVIFTYMAKFNNVVSLKRNRIIKKDDSIIIKEEDEDEEDDDKGNEKKD